MGQGLQNAWARKKIPTNRQQCTLETLKTARETRPKKKKSCATFASRRPKAADQNSGDYYYRRINTSSIISAITVHAVTKGVCLDLAIHLPMQVFIKSLDAAYFSSSHDSYYENTGMCLACKNVSKCN